MAAAPAFAHDPGQGPAAGAFDFRAQLNGSRLVVRARRDGADCAQLHPIAVIARRAGQVQRGILTRDGCLLRGVVRLPSEGRWFVYLDALKARQTVESWIPVKAGEGLRRFGARHRFAYIADRKPATALKWMIGAIMYALVIAFLVMLATLVRAEAKRQTAKRTGHPERVA